MPDSSKKQRPAGNRPRRRTGKMSRAKGKLRRVAVALDLRWGYKRHLEVFVGIQQFARENPNWQCVIEPFGGAMLGSPRGVDRYDGILARVSSPLATQAALARVPVVNVWVSSPVGAVPHVVPDVAAAGRMAAEHLIFRGLRRFAFLGYVRSRASQEEKRGFQSVLSGCDNVAVTSHLVSRAYDANAGTWSRFVASVERWIDTWRRPIGVFVADDLLCRYLAHICPRKGLRIPEDAAIVSLGNETMLCDESEPTLTSIDCGYPRVGYAAAELLNRMMDGEPPPAERTLVRPAELVVRASTDVFAVDDALVAQAMRFIAQHDSEPIRVSDVVAALPVTRRSLERRFRKGLDRTIAQEIVRLRLERARWLILGTNLSIRAIAEATGFANGEHFSKVFRQMEGVSPRRFRQNYGA